MQANLAPQKLGVAPVKLAQVPNNVKTVPGASRVFPSDQKTFHTTSDETGEAVARGFCPNSSCGRFLVGVRASLAGQSATTQIEQLNQGRGHGKAIAILAVVAGGGDAGGCCPTKALCMPKVLSALSRNL